MPLMPALCNFCGLFFSLRMPIGPGSVFIGNQTICPRCRNAAYSFDGYTRLVDDVVTFFLSDSVPQNQKQLVINVAQEASSGQLPPDLAIAKVQAGAPTSGQIFRECVTAGSAALAALAAAGTFLLTYAESRKNEPPHTEVMEIFDEAIRNTPQSVRPLERPIQRPSVQTNIKQSQTDGASSEPPNENRHSRRARLKKERSKGRK